MLKLMKEQQEKVILKDSHKLCFMEYIISGAVALSIGFFGFDAAMNQLAIVISDHLVFQGILSILIFSVLLVFGFKQQNPR